MKKKIPHWIRHTYQYDRDRFECSACHQKFYDTALYCPACGSRITGSIDPQDWVAESEKPDRMLGDADLWP